MHDRIFLLFLAASASTPACVAAHPTSDNGPKAECQANVTLDAGDRVGDLDPVAWTAQYWGSYQGSLVWAAGGQTAVNLTTSQETGQPITGDCLGGKIRDVYTYGRVVLASADGGLNVTYSMIVGGPLPDSPTFSMSPSAFSASGIAASAQSPLASHTTIDFSRYSAESDFALFLDWPTDTAKPLSAELLFEGYPLQAPGAMDTILVSTITFP
jgi:hypothetical protein